MTCLSFRTSRRSSLTRSSSAAAVLKQIYIHKMLARIMCVSSRTATEYVMALTRTRHLSGICAVHTYICVCRVRRLMNGKRYRTENVQVRYSPKDVRVRPTDPPGLPSVRPSATGRTDETDRCCGFTGAARTRGRTAEDSRADRRADRRRHRRHALVR